MSCDERPLSAVPPALWLFLAAALAAQIAWQPSRPGPARAPADLPPPPSPAALRLASFGEPAALSRLLMLDLQSFDLGAGRSPYRELDYGRVEQWLSAALALDPRSDYPLFSAARIYAEVDDPRKCRSMLDFIYREFLKDPNRRWPWLAHAALLAKHRLHDLPLARRYAAAVDRDTTDPGVPLWAKQMEIFILEDMNELQAAKIMLGGLLASGRIRDPAEARFLQQKLRELEARSRETPSR